MGKLDNKTAVITGAGDGIGRVIAQTFAREGASIVIADISEEMGSETERLIKESGGQALYVHTDVSSEPDVINLVEKAKERFGHIDILVNDAALLSLEKGLVTDTSLEVWNKVMSVNVTGAFLCCKYCIPEMLKVKGPAIVNIASRAAIYIASKAAYGASKAALVSLTKTVALQYANCIRSNVICAGSINTPARQRGAAAGFNFKDSAAVQMVQRLGEPEDIANMALFLAGPDSSFITAAVFSVDGGVVGGNLPGATREIMKQYQEQFEE